MGTILPGFLRPGPGNRDRQDLGAQDMRGGARQLLEDPDRDDQGEAEGRFLAESLDNF